MRKIQLSLIAISFVVIIITVVVFIYGSDSRSIAKIGGSFELTDHTGATRTDKDFRGKFMLVYFGYTFCPDVCPTALQVMIAAMKNLDPHKQELITPIFITVDPKRDSVSQLALYVENFHSRLVGLTGSPEAIANAKRAYRVYAAKAKDKGASSDYLMDHSSIIFLMDPEGYYITHFSHQIEPQQLFSILTKQIQR